MKIPELNEDERYAGIALDATGKPTHHLILLPQQPDTRLTWDEAMAWTESIGANLPTRQESALLFANAIDAFEPAWYWTSTQYAGDASYAWCQNFDGGFQGYGGQGYGGKGYKGYKGRVRAVRRFLID